MKEHAIQWQKCDFVIKMYVFSIYRETMYFLLGRGLLFTLDNVKCSYSKQEVVREERKGSSHDTSPLWFWFEGQSEHPLRSSVNHRNTQSYMLSLWVQIIKSSVIWDHTFWSCESRSEMSGLYRDRQTSANHICYVTVVMSSVWSVLYSCRKQFFYTEWYWCQLACNFYMQIWR